MPRLRRVSPNSPGWTRRRAGRGFAYVDAAGATLSADQIEWIRSLVIPPAWGSGSAPTTAGPPPKAPQPNIPGPRPDGGPQGTVATNTRAGQVGIDGLGAETATRKRLHKP